MEGFEVDVAGSGQLALEKARARSYDAILLDVQMPDIDGLRVLETLRAESIDAPVLVMSGHGTIETAVQATRLGAHDFLEKPVGTERLLLSLSHALDFARLSAENAALRDRAGVSDGLLGKSGPVEQLRAQIKLAATASAPVLIAGERGSGKELVARAIHEWSKRAGGPLEKLNCAAVPKDLIESELFGHEAGAFTGAAKQRRGKFERASGGTLFLDEVGDMPDAMQAKLLRVLQEGELERVGGNELLRVDVRVVAATNKSLPKEVAEGRFRADLYDRLNVVPLRVPPLRERRGDIALLSTEFLRRACEANDRRAKLLSAEALALLESYDFPGNVRELRNFIERLVILSPGDEITAADARALLPLGTTPRNAASAYTPGRPLKDMLDDVERELLERALEHHKGHMTKTAQDLGLERSHFYKKLKALGLRAKSEEEGE